MIKQLFEQGIAEHIAKGNEAEVGKVGILRGGSTGMIDEEGNILGSCAAEAYLRFKGIKTGDVDLNKELMFAGGRINEDHWLSVLKTSYDGIIKCEEDIPTAWETSNGTKVTGRPDIVLCKEDGSPKCGIELKQVMSVNSAYNVYVEKKPSLKHLMQAAHYMWQLGCPFELWYTNRNNLEMPSWMEFRKFPRPEQQTEDVIGYRYYRSGNINPKTGKPKKHLITRDDYMNQTYDKSFAQASKIKPFVQGFKLQFQGDQLFMQDAGSDSNPWIPTIVHISYIKRFYEYVSEIDAMNTVPPEAINIDYTGKVMGWKFSAYSDLGDLHPAHYAGKDLQRWLVKIKKAFPQK